MECISDLSLRCVLLNQILYVGVDIIKVMNGEDTITVSWVDQPFTTNITYFINVIQTFGSTETSPLECVLTESATMFTCCSPDHGPCDRFNFTIAPTDGVDNGTSSEPVTGLFTQARGM